MPQLPENYVASFYKKSKAPPTVNSEELELLKKELAQGVIRTLTLRAAYGVNTGATMAIVSAHGITYIYCSICYGIMFAADSITAYFAAFKVCVTCTSNFSKCDKCNTYIYKDDVNNPSHKHIQPKDSIFGKTEVEPYNADIMQSTRNFFLRTPQENILDDHNKLCNVSVLHGPHTPGSLRFFGVELEVEKQPYAPPDMIDRTIDQLGKKFIMVKHDGSIGDHGLNGFEIVSVPATIAYHKSGIWDKFFINLSPFFMESSPTTGLHVHIALNTLGSAAVGKALYFVNSLENREFIESISERVIGKANPNGKIYMKTRDAKISDVIKLKQHASACPWGQLNKTTTNKYLKANGTIVKDKVGNPIIDNIKSSAVYIRPVCKCPPGLYHLEKYEALRIHTSRPTIELRVFRGIVSKIFLYIALEFADALMDFVQQAPPSQLGYNSFLKWMTMYNSAGRSKLYPNLSRHLVQKGWLDPAKPNPKTWTAPSAPALEQVGFFKT